MESIRADRVLEHWMTIVENASGSGERLYTTLEEELKKINIPQVTWSRGDVNMGVMTRAREFLIVKHAGLREFGIYIFARDVGTHLDCGWFLTVTPGSFKRMFSKKMTGDPNALSQNIGVFSQQDLSAWKHILHRMMVKHIREIMREVKMDDAGMNTQSKGYLSVW